MIRVHRGSEEESCPQLAAVRERELLRVRTKLDGGSKRDTKLLGRQYRVACEALAAAQHYKCCYCERRAQAVKGEPIEHYRPKSRYWWLTWTWGNLLFA